MGLAERLRPRPAPAGAGEPAEAVRAASLPAPSEAKP
jgi:hypothetical protein